ncbi:hypothetical protein ABIB73_000025 [Bradyrhizobium sp. F1.4.3]|uniref:hypothetical protein n=1 Tax=Bradyrhizobium sp. F1.4.3 TaxID=3156356 RepID=UPI003399884A
MKPDEAAQSMKSFDDKKRQETIKGFYLHKMNSFVQQLKVPNREAGTHQEVSINTYAIDK